MFCVIPELEYINVLVLAKFAVPVKLISSATLMLPVPVIVKVAAAPTVSWNTLMAAPVLIYGNLTLAGSAPKILPATTTVTGNYLITGASPTLGTGNFVYAGSGTQRITGPADYYNLTVTGNRGGSLISLGNTVSNNVINVANNFVVTATNYTGNGVYNTMNLNSTGTVNIPGFIYGTLNNPGGGPRIFDNQLQ